MFWARRDDVPESQPLDWVNLIPYVDNDPDSTDSFILWETLPLESATVWIDFARIDSNSLYTVNVIGFWPDGTERKVARADISFEKPQPGWPMAMLVNREPVRFDGLLDIGLKMYPFGREVRLIQTRGIAKPLRVAGLTGLYENPSVSA